LKKRPNEVESSGELMALYGPIQDSKEDPIPKGMKK